VAKGTRYAENASLRDALGKAQSESPRPFMRDNGVAILVCGIMVGMNFIHSQGLVHRDPKQEHILIDRNSFLQIADLACARTADLGITYSDRFGSPLSMAPELYEAPLSASSHTSDSSMASPWRIARPTFGATTHCT
jgi:serine/threonine protein kinase